MRLLLLSDIHGNLEALQTVLADAGDLHAYDKVWILGDLAAFGPHAQACIARVRELIDTLGKEKCQVIGGNTDRYLVTGERMKMPTLKTADDWPKRLAFLRQRDDVLNWNAAQLSFTDYEFLRDSIGRELSWMVAGFGGLIGYHAIPNDDELMSLRPDASDEESLDALLDREGRVACGGHTHLPMDKTLGRWRVVNCGSVGMSFSQKGRAEYAILTIDDGLKVDLRAIPYDVATVLAQAESLGYPHMSLLRGNLMSPS